MAVGLLALYLAFLKGHLDSIDGLLIYRQGASVVLHGSIQLTPSVVWGAAITESKYGIGQSLVYAPFIGAAHLLGVHLAAPSTAGTLRQYYEDPLWTVACSWVNCVITAFTAYLVGKCLRSLDATKWQIVLGVLGFGLASPALTYSSSSFAQPLAGLTFALGAFSLFRWSTGGRSNRVLLAAAIATSLVTRPVEGIILGAGSLLFLVVRRTHRSTWVWPLAGLAIGATADLVVNQLRFGSPFQTGYEGERWHPTITGLLGLSISPGRGIVWYMPLCILMPFGLARLINRGRSLEGWWLASIVLLLFLNAALWDMWWGGTNWGPRLFVPALPLVAVLSASAVTTRTSRVVAGVCVLGGFILMLPTILVDLLAWPSAASSTIFQMHDLPVVSAWSSLHQLVPDSATDRSGVDILWTRLAHHGGLPVLAVPLVLFAVALACLALGLLSGSRTAETSA